MVVYLLLAGCLFAELGYRQVWQRAGRRPGRPAGGQPRPHALTQARRRLGVTPLRCAVRPAARPGPGDGHRAGVLVRAAGVRHRRHHHERRRQSPANLAVYSKQPGHHGGSGYPLLRLVALVACGTRTLIDAVFGPVSSGETT